MYRSSITPDEPPGWWRVERREAGERNRTLLTAYLCGLSAGAAPIADGVPLGHLNSAVIDRAARLQKRAVPGEILISCELAAAAEQELGTLGTAVDSEPQETLLSWRAGQPEGARKWASQ